MSLPDGPYWAHDITQLFQALKSSEAGLTSAEAHERKLSYGPNILVKEKKKPAILVFLGKFLDPLIIILLFASSISAFLGEAANFWIILTMIMISVVIDFVQEQHAEKTASGLLSKISLTATVKRDEKWHELPVHDIVPGDVIQLSAGNIVPADGRLLEATDLLINQAALTGESYPQEKLVDVTVPVKIGVSARNNSVFMGTNVLSGEGEYIVTRTGSATEFGKVAVQLTQKQPPTSFEVGIKQFGLMLMKITFVLVITVFFANSLLRHSFLDSFLFALALAVGLTPELLPIVMTLNLSRGAGRMAKKGVIVRGLPAIQDLGSMEVLCTDKTGTLTEDHIVLERYEDITGKENEQVLQLGYLNSHFQAGLKNPMERAILTHTEVDVGGYKKLDEMPFDFHRRRLSVVVTRGAETHIITKGAPESIFACSHFYESHGKVFTLTPQKKEYLMQRFNTLSEEGYRVLALAYKKVVKPGDCSVKDECSMTFLGLMAFLDPPKKNAKDALLQLSRLGIDIKIVTGDNEVVTEHVCKALGLPVHDVVMGEELDKLSGQAFVNRVRRATILARLDPNQKERVIMALKKTGLTVGYLGDGINDAPSIKSADVGISVNNAVDVAKEAADLILLRKDLHVMKDGVIEGRKTHANVMKYIMMGTSSNFGNMFSVAAASFLLPFLPMLPVQILLNNLLYDLSQLALSNDTVDDEVVRVPRNWDMGFIKRFMLTFGPISSLFDFITFGSLLLVFKASQSFFQTGWFVESLVSQSLIIFSIRTRLVPFLSSKPSRWLLVSSFLISGFALILPLTPLRTLFGFVPLPLYFYGFLAALILVYFSLVEFTKKWFYRRFGESDFR